MVDEDDEPGVNDLEDPDPEEIGENMDCEECGAPAPFGKCFEGCGTDCVCGAPIHEGKCVDECVTWKEREERRRKIRETGLRGEGR